MIIITITNISYKLSKELTVKSRRFWSDWAFRFPTSPNNVVDGLLPHIKIERSCVLGLLL